jgi:hypothetical protein
MNESEYKALQPLVHSVVYDSAAVAAIAAAGYRHMPVVN